MDENDIFMVGYGGWVRLKRYASGTPYNYQNPFAIAGEGTLVQATSASISRTKNIPQVMSYYLPFHDREGTARSQMLLGDGTYSFNGEVTFELTLGTLMEFVNEEFFERDTIFSMSFFDGQNVCSVTNCVWNNLQIQCHPGSLRDTRMAVINCILHFKEVIQCSTQTIDITNRHSVREYLLFIVAFEIKYICIKSSNRRFTVFHSFKGSVTDPKHSQPRRT